MGYRIEYGPRKGHKKVFLILAAAMLLTALFLPRPVLEELLLPGDPQVTKEALGQLLLGLRQGVAPGQAVAVFCQSILRGAGIG